MTTVVATVSKKKQFHWDKVAIDRFVQGIVQHGRNWVKIARLIPTVNSSQVKSYSERFFKKLKESAPVAEKQLKIVLVAHAATIKATKVATEAGVGVAKLAALEADEAAAKAAVKVILTTAPATVALKENVLREGWDNEEHGEFLRLIDVHGNQWTTIAAHMVMGNRTGAQVYSHAHSYFNQTKKNDTKNGTTNYTHLKARLAAGKAAATAAAAAAAKKASKDEEDDTSSRPSDASDGGTVAVKIATAKNNNQNKPASKAAKVVSASSSSSNNNDNNTTKKKASLPPRQQLKQQKNTIWKKIKKGSRVAILWPDDKLYYACTVEEQHNGWGTDNSNSRFFVRYDCNGTEWTDMAMEKLRWCEDDEHFDEDDDDDDDEEEQETTGTSSSATSSASAASSGGAAVFTSNRSLPPRSARNGRAGAVSIEHIQAKQRRRQRIIYTMETKILKEPYRGWVKNYKDPYYQVEYENGDVEDLSHSEVTKYLSNYEVNIADIQTSAGGKTKQEWEREQRTQKLERKRKSSYDNADVLRKQQPQQVATEETSAVEEAKDDADDDNTGDGNGGDNVDTIATSQVGSTPKTTTSATNSISLPIEVATSIINTTSLANTDFAILEAREVAAAAQMITTNHFLLLQEYTQYQATAIQVQQNLEHQNFSLKRKADDYDRLESELKRMKVDAKEKEEEVSILLGKHLDTFTSLYDTINKLKADDDTQKETIADLLSRLQSEN